MWGGDWPARFAAHFSGNFEEQPAADGTLAETVNRVIARLPEIERRVVIDYHIMCLSRKAIADRQKITEREVDSIRARAERMLRGMLAGFVEQRFGVCTTVDSACPYCRAAARDAIDCELAARDMSEAWSSLRHRINKQFGLDVRRVQALITHCRFHCVGLE